MRKADDLPPSCTVVTKSGNLKFPEPSGPLQACNGTALQYRFTYFFIQVDKCNYTNVSEHSASLYDELSVTDFHQNYAQS